MKPITIAVLGISAAVAGIAFLVLTRPPAGGGQPGNTVALADGRLVGGFPVDPAAISKPWLLGDDAATEAWFAAHRDDASLPFVLGAGSGTRPDQEAIRAKAAVLQRIADDPRLPSGARGGLFELLHQECFYGPDSAGTGAAVRLPLPQQDAILSAHAALVRPWNHAGWLNLASLYGHERIARIGAERAGSFPWDALGLDAGQRRLVAERPNTVPRKAPSADRFDALLAMRDADSALLDDLAVHGVYDGTITARSAQLLGMLAAADAVPDPRVRWHIALVILRDAARTRRDSLLCAGELATNFYHWNPVSAEGLVMRSLATMPRDLSREEAKASLVATGFRLPEPALDWALDHHPRSGEAERKLLAEQLWFDPWFLVTNERSR